MSNVGVIAIGRNEGERLRRCLDALNTKAMNVVYVDSGSTDGSRELARASGADVVELDTSIPFTAARARNEGFRRLLAITPELEFVQFIDGDCEIRDGWFAAALTAIEGDVSIAVVCGRRRERHPTDSIYNRIADLEWDTPVGDSLACGGDALVRVTWFQEVGGFDDSVAAGEEPELCHRLRQAGGKILRIDAEMTWHDAAVSRLTQWWKRHVRSGYGGLDVQRRFGVDLFAHELRSSRVWTVGWTAFSVAAVCGLGYALGIAGIALAAMTAAGLWLMQAMRIAHGYQRGGFSWPDAFRAGLVTLIVKWANLFGQLRYLRDRRRGQIARMIEYKRSSANDVTPGSPLGRASSNRVLNQEAMRA